MSEERCESCRCFVPKPESPDEGWCNAYNVTVRAGNQMVDCGEHRK